MKLKLEEDPKEWLKFTAVMVVAAGLVLFLLHRGHVLRGDVVAGIGGMLALMLVVCAARPRWFRGFYRAGMTVSWHIGQAMGRVILTIFYLAVMTPMALLLRLLGKDVLALKRDPAAKSYWRAAKTNERFDRQF